jgi:hypothetical protein
MEFETKIEKEEEKEMKPILSGLWMMIPKH